jgi:hypothetical protein
MEVALQVCMFVPDPDLAAKYFRAVKFFPARTVKFLSACSSAADRQVSVGFVAPLSQPALGIDSITYLAFRQQTRLMVRDLRDFPTRQ